LFSRSISKSPSQCFRGRRGEMHFPTSHLPPLRRSPSSLSEIHHHYNLTVHPPPFPPTSAHLQARSSTAATTAAALLPLISASGGSSRHQRHSARHRPSPRAFVPLRATHFTPGHASRYLATRDVLVSLERSGPMGGGGEDEVAGVRRSRTYSLIDNIMLTSRYSRTLSTSHQHKRLLPRFLGREHRQFMKKMVERDVR
jgi:hypothetical protein